MSIEKIRHINELLNKACEIITSLEDHADDTLQKEIDAFFNEVNQMNESKAATDPDEEAQDWDTFGPHKI